LNQGVEILRNYWLIALVSAVLATLTVDFIFRFLLPARGLLRSLRMIRDTIRESNAVSGKDPGDLDAMIGRAKLDPEFAALWLEYSKTLHPQRGTDSFGHQRILHWRATALAEAFFTDQALVDSPLGTEYFKHLPGILTGLGIIGTFGGLIKGLSQFKADADPA
jgi:hypothetical protein